VTTTVGLDAALVLRFKVADFDPAVEGVNVTLTVHDPPAATAVAPVFVCANIAASVPVKETSLIVSEPFPVFATVTTCAAATVPTKELNDSVV
jgi:hypothetical protein